MIIPIFGRVATAVVATLTLSSARNMWQTWEATKSYESEQREQQNRFDDEIQAVVLESLRSSTSTQSAVERLRSLDRNDLLRVFLDSSATAGKIEGEWDGCLLDNNGWVMTSVSGFITNKLFGRGREWNGKAFTSKNETSGVGINRFKQDGATVKEHDFDFQVLDGGGGLAKQSSTISLKYSNYQSPLSPWKTMTDELRFVPFSDKKLSGRVLIGMGYMAWSGGRLNCQPFCLWKK